MPARVLVVDDVPANVKILEAKLTAEYFEVLTAPHGRAALEIAEADMPLRGGAATVPQRVTVSIGVAALLPGEGGDELLRRADEALYAAKNAGRDQVIIAPGFKTAV